MDVYCISDFKRCLFTPAALPTCSTFFLFTRTAQTPQTRWNRPQPAPLSQGGSERSACESCARFHGITFRRGGASWFPAAFINRRLISRVTDTTANTLALIAATLTIHVSHASYYLHLETLTVYAFSRGVLLKSTKQDKQQRLLLIISCIIFKLVIQRHSECRITF